MVNVNSLRNKYSTDTKELTPARLQKLIGHSCSVVRINGVGIVGLRFHVLSVDAKKGTVDLRSEDGANEEKGLPLSAITVAPRKSRGDVLPEGF